MKVLLVLLKSELKINKKNVQRCKIFFSMIYKGLSENGAYKIAPNINKHIRMKLKKLENIKNNNNISLKIKNKNEKIINRKIYNQVDDLH
jgi:hypothetical protein